MFKYSGLITSYIHLLNEWHFYVHENLNLIAQPFNQEKNVGGLKLKVGKCNYG